MIHIYYSTFVGAAAYRNVPILNQIPRDISFSLPETYYGVGHERVGNFGIELLGYDV